MTSSLVLVVADDDPLYRRAVCTTLSSLGNSEIVAEAATGDEAVSASSQHHPDVVVMDIKMPGLDGIEATRRIVQADRETAVLIVTMFEDDDTVFAAMRAGARGYVVKGASEEEIVRAVEAVSKGEAIFSAPVAQRVLRYFATGRGAPEATAFPELTVREREILELIARGNNNIAIAQRLCLSQKTIRNNVSTIFNKLQVADRAQAIVRARQAGLGETRAPPAS